MAVLRQACVGTMTGPTSTFARSAQPATTSGPAALRSEVAALPLGAAVPRSEAVALHLAAAARPSARVALRSGPVELLSGPVALAKSLRRSRTRSSGRLRNSREP